MIIIECVPMVISYKMRPKNKGPKFCPVFYVKSFPACPNKSLLVIRVTQKTTVANTNRSTHKLFTFENPRLLRYSFLLLYKPIFSCIQISRNQLIVIQNLGKSSNTSGIASCLGKKSKLNKAVALIFSNVKVRLNFIWHLKIGIAKKDGLCLCCSSVSIQQDLQCG